MRESRAHLSGTKQGSWKSTLLMVEELGAALLFSVDDCGCGRLGGGGGALSSENRQQLRAYEASDSGF